LETKITFEITCFYFEINKKIQGNFN